MYPLGGNDPSTSASTARWTFKGGLRQSNHKKQIIAPAPRARPKLPSVTSPAQKWKSGTRSLHGHTEPGDLGTDGHLFHSRSLTCTYLLIESRQITGVYSCMRAGPEGRVDEIFAGENNINLISCSSRIAVCGVNKRNIICRLRRHNSGPKRQGSGCAPQNENAGGRVRSASRSREKVFMLFSLCVLSETPRRHTPQCDMRGHSCGADGTLLRCQCMYVSCTQQYYLCQVTQSILCIYYTFIV